MPIGEVISYRDAMKMFNQDTFGSSLWGIPRKGYAPYNALQHIRKGEPHQNFTTIAELKKPEAPITVPTKKQQEKAKDDAKKKAEEDAKKKVIKLKKTVKKVVEENKQLEKAVTEIQKVVAQETPQIALEVNEIVKKVDLPVIEVTTTIPNGMFFDKKDANIEDVLPPRRILPKQMNPKLQASLEKIKKGRDLKNLYMDGKTKDESGAGLHLQGLDEFYDFMADHNGISNKEEAYKFLPDYMKWYNDLFGKPKPKEEVKNTVVAQDDDKVLDKDGKFLYTKSTLAKLESDIETAQKEYMDYFKEKSELESNKTTKSLKLYGNLTKKEAEELGEIEKLVIGKRILKTDPIAKEYNKKTKDFEKRVKPTMQERSDKLRNLKRTRDDLVEKKLLLTGAVKAEDKNVGKIFSIEDSMDLLNRFARKGSPKEGVKKMVENVSKAVDINPDEIEEDWRAKAGYKDTQWKDGFAISDFNRNSQLPREFNKEQGYRWLKETYGSLYDQAIEKTKHIVDVGRPSMTDKEFKNYIRLPFENTEQMKNFFRDVILADPIIYNILHINAHSTKAPSTTNALRDFKKWASG